MKRGKGENGQAVPGGYDDDEGDKDSKRRAAVAAASRATRAKRKRELEELKEKNFRLEKERETFLNTIADLQIKVQALRDTGSIDLRMENDLLRAELMEHKNFISRFKRIADGMPTTNSAKKLMCKQGSDTAVAQVLGLLSTSMADPSWKIGKIRDHPEIDMRYQRLPHGVLAESAKRFSVRIDIPVIPCEDPSLLANIIWRTWCDEDLNKRISKHFGAVSVSVREIDIRVDETGAASTDAAAADDDAAVTKPGPIGAAKESLGNPESEAPSLKNKVKVYYYREETPRTDLDAVVSGQSMENDVVDTVLLLSAREKSISRSSFPQDERFHRFPPRVLQAPTEYKVQEPFTLEEQQGLHAQKNFMAIVLASTSTQHSLGLVPVKPGIHRIRSALLEGSVFRKVEGGVAMSSVFSYPSSMNEDKGKAKHDVLVTDDGFLNATWTQVITEVYAIMREHMPEYVFDSYRKMQAQGAVLPKEIRDYL